MAKSAWSLLLSAWQHKSSLSFTPAGMVPFSGHTAIFQRDLSKESKTFSAFPSFDYKLIQNLPRSKSGICDNQVQSKSKIPDFERERIEGGNHSNPATAGFRGLATSIQRGDWA